MDKQCDLESMNLVLDYLSGLSRSDSNVSLNFGVMTTHLFIVFTLFQADSVERFHISAFMLFVLAQNIREAEDPWFGSFLFVSLCC